VSLIRCSVCEQRQAEKLSQLYWAWNLAGGARRAYKQRLCVECFRTRILGILVDMRSDPYNCPGCHTDCEDNMDAVYLDLYMPNMPKERLEMACCPECAVTIRNAAMEGAEVLPDRQAGNGGPQPPMVNSAAAWEALGLRPPPRA
jgi:hypothetical protein